MVDGAVPLRDIDWPPASFGRTAGTSDTPTSTQMGRYTVWIRNDLAELRQGLFTADANLAVVLRSRGVASDGRTNVVLEVTMVPSQDITKKDPESGLSTGDPCGALGKNACDDNSSTQYGIVVGP
jgi:hypothetical protein